MLHRLGGKRKTNSVLMFTPKAPRITRENLTHSHLHTSPHHHCTGKQRGGRIEAGKAKVSEDTTWSPLKGNLCIGWHLPTSLQSQCMHTAGLVLLSNQLLLSLSSSHSLKQWNMTLNSLGWQNNRISFCSSYNPSHIYADSARLSNCSSTKNS